MSKSVSIPPFQIDIPFVAQDAAGYGTSTWNHIVASDPTLVWMPLDGLTVLGFDGDVTARCGAVFTPLAYKQESTEDMAGVCAACQAEEIA